MAYTDYIIPDRLVVSTKFISSLVQTKEGYSRIRQLVQMNLLYLGLNLAIAPKVNLLDFS